MTRLITSPVKRWPGTVTIADPITLPQYIAWCDALDVVNRVKNNGAATGPRRIQAVLPGVLACVTDWQIEGLPLPTAETWPMKPRAACVELANWLFKEVSRVIDEEESLPNE